MKKIALFLVTLAVGSQLIAKPSSAAEQLIVFKNMEKGHKADWLSFMGKNAVTKTELIKKQHADWVEFGNRHIEDLDKMKDWSNASKQEFFSKHLRDAISLHKSHMAAWKAWARNKEDAAKKLCEKHEAELAKFEASLGK